MRFFDSRLVPNWRAAWRWWSVQIHVIATAVLSLLLLVPTLPTEVQGLIPEKAQPIAIAVWFVIGLAARLIKQKGKAE